MCQIDVEFHPQKWQNIPTIPKVHKIIVCRVTYSSPYRQLSLIFIFLKKYLLKLLLIWGRRKGGEKGGLV